MPGFLALLCILVANKAVLRQQLLERYGIFGWLWRPDLSSGHGIYSKLFAASVDRAWHNIVGIGDVYVSEGLRVVMVNTKSGAHVVEVHWQFLIHNSFFYISRAYRFKVFYPRHFSVKVWVYRFLIAFMNLDFLAFEFADFVLRSNKKFLFWPSKICVFHIINPIFANIDLVFEVQWIANAITSTLTELQNTFEFGPNLVSVIRLV